MARVTKVPGEQTPPETETTEQNQVDPVQPEQEQVNTTAAQADEALAHIATSDQTDTETGEQTPPDWALKILAGQARIEAKLRSMSLPQAKVTQPQQGIPPIQQTKQPAQVLTAQGWGSKES